MNENIASELAQAVATFNEGFAERNSKELQLGKYIPITQKGNEFTESIAYGVVDGTSDIGTGFIDENTTSFDTNEVSLRAKKGFYLDWRKVTAYTDLGIAKAKNYGLDLDTSKIRRLEINAMDNLINTALIGGSNIEQVAGLFNSPDVAVDASFGAFDLNDPAATFNKAMDVLLDMYDIAYRSSDYEYLPDTMVLNSDVLQKFRRLMIDNIATNSGKISVIESVIASIKDSYDVDLKILPLLPKYAKGLKLKPNLSRVAIYKYGEDFMHVDCPIYPTASIPLQKSVGLYEVAVDAKFTGAIVKQPKAIRYFDIKAIK